MGIVNADEKVSGGDIAAEQSPTGTDYEKGAAGLPEPTAREVNGTSRSSASGADEDGFDSDANSFQDGVERVRAITSIWSKTTLASMFALLYLVSFVDYLQNAIDASLNLYVTSSFGAHGLLNIGSILATILGGCAPLALAKVIDIWGRVEGFSFMLLITVVGIIMKALCKNVETYVAGHTLYWTGHIGIQYVMTVMISDMTTLKNRMILIGLNNTPRIASTFAGPAVGEAFYEHSTYRWAFGAFAIILVACSLPAIGLMIRMWRQAVRQGALSRRKGSGRTFAESAKYYIIEFDVIGLILIMGALSCLLLPFSLAPYAPKSWSTPYIIAMIVLGVVLFPIFYLWEAKYAPIQFLPFKYLKQGTIIGSCLLYGIMFLSTFIWNAYYNSYLQVVHRQSITNAGYILNAYSLTATVFAPLIGFLISWTGDFKWTAYAGVPLMLLGTALIIPLRQPDTNPGVLALTQILVGLGSSFFTTCSTLAVMAPVTHQHIAVVNALVGLFGGVGASVGYAIAGGMWNNLLPIELSNRLPPEWQPRYHEVFGNVTLQMEFADGTPERAAVVASYAHVMRLMCIAGAAIMPLCALSIFVWKNINVKKLEEERGKQTKGMVF